MDAARAQRRRSTFWQLAAAEVDRQLAGVRGETTLAERWQADRAALLAPVAAAGQTLIA